MGDEAAKWFLISKTSTKNFICRKKPSIVERTEANAIVARGTIAFFSAL